MTGKGSELQAIKMVRLLDRRSGKPIHVSHEYSLEKDGGYSREEVTEGFLRQGASLTIIGFLEEAQPLPYSAAAILDYPDIHFTRKQEAWRLEKSEVAGGGQLPQPVSTSLGVILPLICYDAYRFGSGKAPLGPWDGIDLIVVPAWWEKNFPVLKSAVRRLTHQLTCSAVIVDVKHGTTIYNQAGRPQLELADESPGHPI